MNTRSVKSSQVSAFGIGSGDADGAVASPPMRNAPWSDRADIQPGGREAGPAVEREGHRAVGFLGVLKLERDEGQFGARRLPLVGEQDGAGGRREVQRAAGQFERVMGGDVRGQPARFDPHGRPAWQRGG